MIQRTPFNKLIKEISQGYRICPDGPGTPSVQVRFAQGKRIKKLTPILVKTEPDREYTQHFHSDSELPKIPEEHFIQEREVTIASYSETISSELSSEDRT